jgi:hypothetical protein
MADDAFHLTLREMPGYLHARATGAHTSQNAARFMREVHQACVERKIDSVLIEMAMTGPSLPPAEIFAVVADRSFEGSRMRRVAYVDPTDRDPTRMKFAETVAVNRGVNVRLFRDVEEAHRWLASSSS